MAMFKRVGLFLLTNILILVTVSISFNLLAAAFGWTWADQYLPMMLLMCGLMGFGGAFISLMISKWMAKRAYGVEVIDPRTNNTDHRALLEMVYSAARRAQLKTMPEVGIYQSPEANAFATGPSKNNSLVAVSSGLLNSMSRDEVEGVIGHEVAHIANGDMVTLTLIQGVVNTFVMFFARIIANMVASNVDEKIRPMVHFALVIALDILFAVLASVVVAYFSRIREFRADLGGAKFTSRAKMIASLQRLQSQYDRMAPDNGSVATMKISNKASGIMRFFSTHPPLSERILRLQKANIS